MNNDAKLVRALKNIAKDYPDLFSDNANRRRAKSVLLDELAQFGREKQLLLAAIDSGIPHELLSAKNDADRAQLAQQAFRVLTEQEYRDADAARWVISVWAKATGANIGNAFGKKAPRHPPRKRAQAMQPQVVVERSVFWPVATSILRCMVLVSVVLGGRQLAETLEQHERIYTVAAASLRKSLTSHHLEALAAYEATRKIESSNTATLQAVASDVASLKMQVRQSETSQGNKTARSLKELQRRIDTLAKSVNSTKSAITSLDLAGEIGQQLDRTESKLSDVYRSNKDILEHLSGLGSEIATELVPEIHFQRGITLLKKKADKQAQREFLAAIDAGKCDADAFYRLGESLVCQEKLKEAEVALARALEIDQFHSEADDLYVRVRTALGRPVKPEPNFFDEDDDIFAD